MWTLAASPLAVLIVALGPKVADAGSTDPLVSLTQYGPLGLMVLGFLTGWIVPGPTARAQASEITRLQALFENEVLPMAKTYAETMSQTTKVLEKAIDALKVVG